VTLTERIEEHKQWIKDHPNENQGRKNALLRDLIQEYERLIVCQCGRKLSRPLCKICDNDL
jgi:hypothetical protein